MGCRFLARKAAPSGHVRVIGQRTRRAAVYIYWRQEIFAEQAVELMPRRARPRIAFLMLTLAPVLAGCGEGAPKQAAPPPQPVTVAKAQKQTVTDYDEYVGRFVAIDMVEVRARVSGYLEKIHFQDGQLVKQGDLLFTVDRRPF